MDSKLEEQRSVIKFRLLEGGNLCHIFHRLQKSFSEAYISGSTFYSRVSQFREGKTSVRDKPGHKNPLRSTVVANVKVFINKDC